ncbi:MAG: peptidase M15, partial [Mesorhizobium sp.]
SATDAFSVLPTARPDAGKPDEIKAVLEQASATTVAGSSGAEYEVASLTAPEPRSAFNDPSGLDAASPRQAIAARPAGTDPAQAARASANDLKPGPTAMVVATPPQAARWALGSGDNIATVSDPTTAPRYAYNIVHTPPSEVYTAGFQTDAQLPDASRFTGNAVKFLSVARFQTK